MNKQSLLAVFLVGAALWCKYEFDIGAWSLSSQEQLTETERQARNCAYSIEDAERELLSVIRDANLDRYQQSETGLYVPVALARMCDQEVPEDRRIYVVDEPCPKDFVERMAWEVTVFKGDVTCLRVIMPGDR